MADNISSESASLLPSGHTTSELNMTTTTENYHRVVNTTMIDTMIYWDLLLGFTMITTMILYCDFHYDLLPE